VLEFAGNFGPVKKIKIINTIIRIKNINLPNFIAIYSRYIATNIYLYNGQIHCKV